MKSHKIVLVLSIIIAVGCSVEQPEEKPKLQIQAQSIKKVNLDEDALLAKAQGYFKPLPAAVKFGDAKTTLGKKLYYETSLSVNNKLSCNSCHMLDKYGVDGESTSPGHEGKRGDRNSPTVYNASLHIAQFWDGRAADLTEQAKGPILNPVEMGIASEEDAVANIKKIEEYHELFKGAFSGSNPITYQNIAGAIAEFEKTLLTPSKVDDYLNGNKNALSNIEKAGMQTFINTGCITCHTGEAFGGNMYHKFGLVNGPYWKYTKSDNRDEGRVSVTKNPNDLHYFKVPSLRNISKTAPYFHDGSIDDLGEAVKIMAKTQLDKDLNEEQVESILAFLDALTGDIPQHAL